MPKLMLKQNKKQGTEIALGLCSAQLP